MQRDFNTMNGTGLTPVSVEPETIDFDNYLEAIKLVVYGTGLDPKSVTLMESTCKVFSEMSLAPELPTEYWSDQVCTKFPTSLTNEQFQFNVKWKNIFSKCMNDLHHLNKAKKEMVTKTQLYLMTDEYRNFGGIGNTDLFNIIRKHSIPLSQTVAQNKKEMMDAIITYCLEIINSKDKSIDKKEVYELLSKFKNQVDENPIAQYCLGVCYQSGYGTNVNLNKARDYLESSADQGNKDAQYLTANICHNEGNQEKAFEFYKKSADQGHSSALDCLGFYYQNGIGTSPNLDDAIKCYKLSADQGNAKALTNLGFVYLTVIGDKTLSFNNYKLAADLGHSHAQLMLSYAYQAGNGTDVDQSQAFKYSKLSADQGHPEAQLYLGLIYKQGYGVAVNLNEAFKYIKLAADTGNSEALNELGLCYLNGLGTEVNPDAAIKCLNQNANKINPDTYSSYAHFILSKHYKSKGNVYEFISHLEIACQLGLADAKNELGAYLKTCQLQAESGDAEAQFMLSMILKGSQYNYVQDAFRYAQASASQGNSNGQNMVGWIRLNIQEFKEPIEAFKYFKLSAEQANMYGQWNLGYCYEHGVGTDIDLLEACKAYKLSADQGYATAQNWLANMYVKGKGVNQDMSLAFRYYTLAANQGRLEAITSLAGMHSRGLGRPIDLVAAASLFKIAADQGFTQAQFELALLLENGTGVARDYAKAFNYYKLAADKGHENAQAKLGEFYRYGNKGIPTNLELAFKYYMLSFNQGNTAAYEGLAFFYRNGLQHQFLKKS